MVTQLSPRSDWTFDDILSYTDAICEIAEQDLKLDVYPNQIEIITAEQMIDAYSSHGLPVMYKHWSFGKNFVFDLELYKKGKKGLAYEIVINSNPCIAYLMEENTLPMQALVIAHACYGHNAFFKNNYLFKEHTHAESIVDYMCYVQKYILDCEVRYGESVVEDFLDCVHSLGKHGFFHCKRPEQLSKQRNQQINEERIRLDQAARNELWDKIIPKNKNNDDDENKKFKIEPTENILDFLEKYAPNLEEWKREILRIMQRIQQYFVPQLQTQVCNEGFATFTHYYIINRLYEKGLVSDAFMQELLISHTGVIQQLPYNHPYYNGINPYALGFNMFMDIKRICENPTEEDKHYLPHLIGRNWVEAVKEAAFEYRDETFITQYLSPKVVRDMKMFSHTNDTMEPYIEITGIQDEEGFKEIRAMLARQKNVFNRLPQIEVSNVDPRTRELILKHKVVNHTELSDDTLTHVVEMIHRIWGFDVSIFSEHTDELDENTTYKGKEVAFRNDRIVK